MITIEKNIPIPVKLPSDTQDGPPIARLEIGDSFFFECAPNKMYKRIWTAQERGKYKGKKFLVKAVLKSGIRGCRVWRTE